MRGLHITALVLAIIGAINWGLVGLFEFDLVAAIFGEMTTFTRIIYTLVGIAGVILIGTSPAFSGATTGGYRSTSPAGPR